MVSRNPLVLSCLAAFAFPVIWNALLHLMYLELFYIALKAFSTVKPSQTSLGRPSELSEHLSSELL